MDARQRCSTAADAGQVAGVFLECGIDRGIAAQPLLLRPRECEQDALVVPGHHLDEVRAVPLPAREHVVGAPAAGQFGVALDQRPDPLGLVVIGKGFKATICGLQWGGKVPVSSST